MEDHSKGILEEINDNLNNDSKGRILSKLKQEGNKKRTINNIIKYQKREKKNIKKSLKNKNIQIINKNENIQKSIKIRNPGVDLIRMIAMLGIIINHLVYQGNGLGKFPQYKRQLLLLNSLFFWHNDGYILISGVVGYKSNKYSNLLYLWLSTLFYSILIPIYFAKISSHSNKSLNISVEYFPVIFKLY